jgi:hypothetical protein
LVSVVVRTIRSGTADFPGTRGDTRQAADCYRKVIALIRKHLNYEPSFEEMFVELADPATRQ